jgi:hypothetical protein
MSNVIIMPIMSYIFGLFCGILICCLCIALAEFTEKPTRRIVAPKEGK